MPNIFRTLPPLSTLVVFESAFRLCSFTKAADELALSQASVSRRVRELEKDLGVTLFERRQYDVQPTTNAELLASSVRSGLLELKTVADRLRQGNSGSHLTIYSDMSLASALVTPLLPKFQRLHPDVQVRLVSSYEPIQSHYEYFDFGLQYGAWGKNRFEHEALADETIFPVCAPSYAERFSSPLDAEQLVNCRLLHLDEIGKEWPTWHNLLASYGINAAACRDQLSFSSYQICIDAAEQGEGIALGWKHTVKSQLDTGRLVRASEMEMKIAEHIVLHTDRKEKLNPAALAFISLLKEKMSMLHFETGALLQSK